MGRLERQPPWDLTGARGNLIITFDLRELFSEKERKLIRRVRNLGGAVPPPSEEKMEEGKRKVLKKAKELAGKL